MLNNSIKQIRERNNKSQKQLCEEFNEWQKERGLDNTISQPYLSSIEKGRKRSEDLENDILKFMEENYECEDEIDSIKKRYKGRYDRFLEHIQKIGKEKEFFMLEILNMLTYFPHQHLKAVYDNIRYSVEPYIKEKKILGGNIDEVIDQIRSSAMKQDNFIYPMHSENHINMEAIIEKFLRASQKETNKIIEVLIELIDNENVKLEIKSNLFWQLCVISPKDAIKKASSIINIKKEIHIEIKRATCIAMSLEYPEKYYDIFQKDEKLRKHSIKVEERIWGDKAFNKVCEMIVENKYSFINFFQIIYLEEKISQGCNADKARFALDALNEVIADVNRHHMVRNYAKKIIEKYSPKE